MDFQLNLNSETVEHAYSADALSIEPGTTVREVFRLLKEHNQGCVLICRDGVLAGIFTERDALRLMGEGADLDRPIEQVMAPDPVALSPQDTVETAITKMSQGGYRRLPIVDGDGRPLGVLKVSGILRFLVEHFPNVIYTLPPTPHYATHQREGA